MSNKDYNKNYKLTIGLEIHAELKTRTKMFCNSKNDPDEKRPNVNICPVCMGHPGTLPVINREAVKHVLKVGVSVGGELADFTEFDRKNYFYPDIPKGYQISQYKFPLVKGGKLAGVELTRIHLEEDTAKSGHEEGDYSLVDFNRAGLPLMELVTEPVISSAEEAGKFARELQLLLRYLDVSDANMEKGEMRVEANISVADDRTQTNADLTQTSAEKKPKLGTKVEVKNLNSFRSVERAIEYEVKRQVELLEAGEVVVQETRGWDEGKQQTYSQRVKEDSHDYRYFPEPDLPKLVISEIPDFQVDALRKALPELPSEARARLIKKYGDQVTEANLEILVRNVSFGNYLNHVNTELNHDEQLSRIAFNYATSDLIGLMKKQFGDSWEAQFPLIEDKIPPTNFASLSKLVAEDKVSSRGAKDVLAIMYKDGGEPEKIAEVNSLLQRSNEGELMAIVKTILEANPNVVADYKGGKESALQFLVGQGMKATKGSANPKMLATIIQATLA